jgi:hypothetical protein
MNRSTTIPYLVESAAPLSSADDQRQTLARILTPEVRIVICRRPIATEITRDLDRLVTDGTLTTSMRLTVTVGEPPALPGLRAAGAVDWLTDLAYLVEIYGQLCSCAQVRLRLEVIHRAMCPRFHVDRVGIRLLCTYRGPATEWLDDRFADRTRLGVNGHGLSDEESGLIRDPAAVHRVPPFAIVLLKGDLWPGNAEQGLIHRSPAPLDDEAPRVLVALDAI